MVKEIDDGGPAFPHIERNDDGSIYRQHPGMSLRDYFACRALPGLFPGHSPDVVAEVAYKLADAMIAARRPATDGGVK